MADSSVSVEELSASLVREYLARKGLKETLTKLDEELPRSSESISNRTALAKAVHIDKLMRKNKADGAPYRTMIEVIVKSLTTSASKKASATSHATTVPTKSLTPKEGVASTTPQQKGGASRTPQSDIPTHTEGLNPSHFGKSKNEDTQMATSKMGSLSISDHGKPITSFPTTTTNPITTHEFSRSHPAPSHLSEVPQSALSHLNKPTYPHGELSPLRESTRRGLTTEPRKHSATVVVQKEKARVVSVKPRGGVQVKTSSRGSGGGGAGGGVINVASGHTVSLQSGSNTGSSARGLRTSLISREVSALKSAGSKAESAKLKPHQGSRTYRDEVIATEDDSSSALVTFPKEGTCPALLTVGSDTAGKVQQVKVSDPSLDNLLLCEDLEDIDVHVGASLPSAAPTLGLGVQPSSKGHPIDLTTAKALRELVFGSATGPSFNAEWRRQNFEFCDVPKLEYGLVQHKGGPCGLLAGVQAYILKHLIFSGSESKHTSSPRPTHEERRSALAAALTDILWKAGQQKSATVSVTTRNSIGGKIFNKNTFSSIHYKPDNLTEMLMLQTFTTYDQLLVHIGSLVPLLEDASSSGCISFLYSLLLSRGIENIKSDMDADTALLGTHQYCTQELVNLILTGIAVSNVFNGTQEVGNKGEEKIILRGTQGPCELGFLSLFEHYGTCIVGSDLKDPEYPIWVVCSESHFTVLFSHQRRLLQDSSLQMKFNLHYYDGLANQDEDIILTIDNSAQDQKPLQQPISNGDLVPPLDLVIKTKWKLAEIDWNETEPIL